MASRLVPNLTIDGKTAQNQSYFQDQNNYYVKFLARLNATETMRIQFTPGAPIFDIRYVVLIVAIIAIIVVGLLLALRRGSRRSFYLPSQPN
jgi:subtilase family serine protease